MFTVYALDMSEPGNDQEVDCATLDDALQHLRELITAEIEDEDGPLFDRYGVRLGA